jgi:hypothetical protein
VIEIVSATRLAEATFWKTSAHGISLQRLSRDRRIRSDIVFQNSRGLRDIYSARLAAAHAATIAA